MISLLTILFIHLYSAYLLCQWQYFQNGLYSLSSTLWVGTVTPCCVSRLCLAESQGHLFTHSNSPERQEGAVVTLSQMFPCVIYSHFSSRHQ